MRADRGVPSGLSASSCAPRPAAGCARARQVPLSLPSLRTLRGRAAARPRRPAWLSAEGVAHRGPGRPGRRPGADPRGDLVLVIAGVDPAIGLFASFTMAVMIAIVGGRPRDDLRRHRRRRPGHRPAQPRPRPRLPDRRRHPGRRLPGRPRRARRGQADAVRAAQRDGRLRQRAGHPASSWRRSPRLRDVPWPVYPLVVGRPGADGVLPEDHQGRSRRRWCPSSS